jgi:nucleoside-diphosphate-sugar epimerase
MKRSIVTGGAGFIGSNLVRRLLAAGHHVQVIDNLATGKRANLAEAGNGVVLHEVDICDYDAIVPILRGADYVFHLAALPSVPKSIVDPVPSHQYNINGTFSVYRAAAEAKVKRLVYAASSSAYGDTVVLPKVETMAPQPKSPYAVQKLLGEYYAAAFHSCFGLETVSLRFFNVYGPRQDPGSVYSGVLSLFMKCLIERRSPTIFGDGEQSRDFTFVDDVCSLMMKATEAPGVAGRVYNAGNGGRFTLNETWALLEKIEGIRLEPMYGPPRAGDVRDSQADTTAAVRELGHAPQYTFEEGLRQTLQWYKTDYRKRAELAAAGVSGRE